ncbi:MAG: ATP-binding protein, partial [Burkholderiaceae bacterium]|nr:ATP-binding protein [Burkholderiaceae bacterium]
AAPLAQRDLANVQELLEALVREQAFAYVELRDPRSGRPLAAAGDVALAAGITPTPAKGATPETPQEARGAFHFSYDVALGGQVLAVARFGIDARYAGALRDGIARDIVLVALTGLTLALLLQLAAVRLVMRPLEALARRADRIADGQRQEALPERGDPELVVLTRSFNRMAQVLDGRIAELRAQEQYRRVLMEALGVATGVIDEHGRVLECNAAAAALLGAPCERLVGNGSQAVGLQFVDLKGRPLTRAELPSVRALRSGEAVRGQLIGIVRADGRRLWTSVDALPIPPEVTPAARAVIVSATDITELVEAKRALQDLTDQLDARVAERTAQLAAARDAAERASRAKSEFLSRMSHELRTPLNAILGFAQILRLRMGEQAPPALAQIEAAGWHLLELINEVLELSRIETGAIAISVDAVALAPLLAECVQLTQPLRDKQAIALFDRSGAVSGVAVAADATRLKQVFVNLLSNAAKYNRPGGSVEIDVDADERTVRVHVRDSGIGMNAEQIASLFEPFNRLGVEKTGIEGTGIGLVIAKRLLELMGGAIAVQSTPGVGSVFTVTLPRAPARTTAPVPAPVAQPARPALATAPRVLLYVEDNPSNVQLMAEVLALRPQFRLLALADAVTAYKAVLDAPPDIAVIDIALPGMDGHALCRQLRALPTMRDRPIVALSANAMPSDRRRGAESGFDRYFTKPLDVAQFLAWLDETSERLR